jgi:hypothetical protein
MAQGLPLQLTWHWYTQHTVWIYYPPPHPTVKGLSMRLWKIIAVILPVVSYYTYIDGWGCVCGDGWILYNAYTSVAVYHWQIPPGFDMCISEVSGDI